MCRHILNSFLFCKKLFLFTLQINYLEYVETRQRLHFALRNLLSTPGRGGGGGTPYIRMRGTIVVFFRGCNRRFSIF